MRHDLTYDFIMIATDHLLSTKISTVLLKISAKYQDKSGLKQCKYSNKQPIYHFYNVFPLSSKIRLYQPWHRTIY